MVVEYAEEKNVHKGLNLGTAESKLTLGKQVCVEGQVILWRPESKIAALRMSVCMSPVAVCMCASLSRQALKARSHHSEVTAPAFFPPLSSLLQGGRSSCKWWFKVPPAPNCHPTVYETDPWLWIPGTLLQLPVAVTACSGLYCNWCQLGNRSPHHFWISQPVMHSVFFLTFYIIYFLVILHNERHSTVKQIQSITTTTKKSWLNIQEEM